MLEMKKITVHQRLRNGRCYLLSPEYACLKVHLENTIVIWILKTQQMIGSQKRAMPQKKLWKVDCIRYMRTHQNSQNVIKIGVWIEVSNILSMKLLCLWI